MRVFFLFLFISLFLVSCGARKTVVNKQVNKPKTENFKNLESHFKGNVSKTNLKIVKSAEQYLGVPYKFGGNSKDGLDCSGFVCKVYSENEQKLPRKSEEQAKEGKLVTIEEVRPGDLLFFATSGGTKISHVGIVHDIMNLGEVKFIHASTSKGVIISSLNEKYWNTAFQFARRLN